MSYLRESFVSIHEERLKEDLDDHIKLLLDLSYDLDILDIIGFLKLIYEYRCFLKFKNSKENNDE